MSLTPTQLKQRRKFLGGSEIAVIMGWSPFQTAAGLWDEKMGLVEPKPSSDAMDFGTYLEDGIAKLWQHRQMKKGAAPFRMLKHKPLAHPVHRFMRASPDRILYHDTTAFEGLEVKCISAFSEAAGGWGRSGGKEYPLYYKAQCAWNRFIFDLPRWNLVALTADRHYTLKHYVYEQEVEFEQSLIDAALKFWTENMLAKVRPPEPPKDIQQNHLTGPEAPSTIPLPSWAT